MNKVINTMDVTMIPETTAYNKQTSKAMTSLKGKIPVVPEMSSELSRISSFSRWPVLSTFSVLLLVSSGLFYTGISQQLQCYMCGLKMDSCTDGEDQVERHRRLSNKCHLSMKNNAVKKENNMCNKENFEIIRTANDTEMGSVDTHETDNNLSQDYIRINDNNSALDLINGTLCSVGTHAIQRRDNSSSDRLYEILANRLSSFTGRWSVDSPVTPEELSAAGLYFTGPGDKVKCAYCRGGLYNWEMGDVPVEEHKKHFPQCPFVRHLDSIQENHEIHIPHMAQLQPHECKINVAKSIAQELGFPSEVIDEAIGQLGARGKITSVQLIDTIHEIQNNREDITRAIQMDVSQQESSISNLSHNSLAQQDISNLISENQRLKESTTCKVCLEEEVTELFLPCRHLVCCHSCSSALNHCPVCRGQIRATVKAFFS